MPAPANGAAQNGRSSHGPGATVLGVDIGGTNLRIGAVRQDLDVENFEIVSSGGMLEVDDPSAALGTFISDYLTRHHSASPPRALALGFPATVDRHRRVVLSTSNIRSMQNLPIADYLEDLLGIPTVIDRDVNNLLRYDMRSLEVPTDGIIIGCYIGTGLGNAIGIDGRILVGKHGVAGELGHLPTLGLKGICGCGNVGCIETVASGRYFAEMARTTFPKTPLERVMREHLDHPAIADFLHHVAIPIAAEINILDPDAVILGGGVVAAEGFPRARLEAEVRALTRKPLPSADITFRYSSGGQQAGVAGAGVTAWTYIAEARDRTTGSLTLGEIK